MPSFSFCLIHLYLWSIEGLWPLKINFNEHITRLQISINLFTHKNIYTYIFIHESKVLGEHVAENHDPYLGLMTMYSWQLELTQKYLNSMVINSNHKGAGHYEFISGKIKVSLILKISPCDIHGCEWNNFNNTKMCKAKLTLQFFHRGIYS